VNYRAMGKVGLGGGLKGKLSEKVAEPIAERTSFDKETILAIIGAIFLLLTIKQFVSLMRRVIQAGRAGELDLELE
jgi:hypothetical protein